eukprot:gene25889-31263_t
MYYGECEDEPGFEVMGIATDVCLANAPNANSTSKSFMFSCSGDTWISMAYSNENCDSSGLLNTTSLSVPASGECGVFPPVSTDDDYLAGYVAKYFCSASNTIELSADYVLSRYYDSDSCSVLGSFNGPMNGGCVPFTYLGITYTLRLTYPSGTLYLGSSCSGLEVTSFVLPPLNDTCSSVPADDDGDDDDIFSNDLIPIDDPVDDDDDMYTITWAGYTTALTCTVPSTTSCDTTDDASTSSNDDGGLSDGAVAGVTIGTAAGAAVIIGAGVFLATKGGVVAGLGASSGGAAGGLAAQAAEGGGSAASPAVENSQL